MSRQFTTEAEKALNKAAKFAIRMGQRIVGSEHLLFGLSAAPGVAAKVLKENGMDKERLDIEVREYCGMSDVVEMEPLRGETSPKLEELLLAAAEEAGKMQLKETGTEHMLLAILKDTSCVAYKILLASGAPIQKLYTDIILTTGGDMVQAKNELIASRSRNKKNSGTPTLDQYARDLTQYAKDGKLDPVLNRDDEIESVIGILSRRMKNNPCLIGEPGVGKTAIVEGLASRIVDGRLRSRGLGDVYKRQPVLWMVRCRIHWNKKEFLHWICPAWLPVRNTVANLRSGLNVPFARRKRQEIFYFLSTNCIPLLVPAAQKEQLTHQIF